MPYYVGLDLGQAHDYSALAVIQTVRKQVEGSKWCRYLHLRHLERFPLGTAYTDVAEHVRDLLFRIAVADEFDPTRMRTAKAKVELLVDRTGVGQGVVDIFKSRSLKPHEITIIGGLAERARSTGIRQWSVPKADLVAALLVPFENNTLKIAEGLALWPALRQELQNFKRKQNKQTGYNSYEHWRDSQHDDLVLASAMAVWGPRKPRTGSTKTRVLDVHGRWHTL